MLVAPGATIRDALIRFSLAKGCVLHNGLILDEAGSFAMYGFKPNDTLVLLPEATVRSDMHEWLTMTHDVTEINARVDLVMNADFRRSMARLKDLAEFRLDKRPRQFRARSRNYQAWLEQPRKSNQQPLTLAYDRPEGPICEPLPCMWASA
jgi:hypothetical protein